MWISTPHQQTMGLPQGFLLSHVLFSVYTNGLAELNSIGLSQVLTLEDNGLIYETANDTHTAVTAVQEQLAKVSQWYQETGSKINLSKAKALWCTLNNKAVAQAMPAVSLNREVIKHLSRFRYLRIDFDRLLTYKMQVEIANLMCTESHGCKRHWRALFVPAVSEWDTWSHWLWSRSHNLVTVQPAEAWHGVIWRHDIHSGNNKRHSQRLHSTPWTYH